jgi:hypothetical protein
MNSTIQKWEIDNREKSSLLSAPNQKHGALSMMDIENKCFAHNGHRK